MASRTFNQDQFHQNIKDHSHWIRLAYMLLFAVLLHVAGVVMWVICAVQFVFVLGTGRENENLRSLGKSLASFIHQALEFVSYNTERKPFPFSPWPEGVSELEPIEEAVIVDEPTAEDTHQSKPE
ncbi:DUF4389 domain-containing protein [Teredinibacter franksiae]|uniref:DUF4389 domain-containing protein n=1 Tax=Teredinibacter franksiae TaxID=2761453 RepID=UPI001625F9CC|nr:DUF4389 domain-containing protein [Teredinibacter franksiae]